MWQEVFDNRVKVRAACVPWHNSLNLGRMALVLLTRVSLHVAQKLIQCLPRCFGPLGGFCHETASTEQGKLPWRDWMRQDSGNVGGWV